jgi:hypothetical protein
MTKQIERKIPDAEMVVSLRRAAEDLRTGKSKNPFKRKYITAEELADMADEYADRIEAGEIVDGVEVEEELTPEQRKQLLAEAKLAKGMADLLRRHDAGSLAALIKRDSKKKK